MVPTAVEVNNEFSVMNVESFLNLRIPLRTFLSACDCMTDLIEVGVNEESRPRR